MSTWTRQNMNIQELTRKQTNHSVTTGLNPSMHTQREEEKKNEYTALWHLPVALSHLILERVRVSRDSLDYNQHNDIIGVAHVGTEYGLEDEK